MDSDFSGGNIAIQRVTDDGFFLAPDLRDTQAGQTWFYWSFRLKSSQTDPIPIIFSGQNVIGVRGPAISLDSGLTWRWLGSSAVSERSVQGVKQYQFWATPSRGGKEVRYAFCPNYLQVHFDQWWQKHRQNRHLQLDRLCLTPAGRSVELVRAGCLQPDRAIGIILLTARHHCCEALASYALEGILDTVLSSTAVGSRWRQWQVAAVPFMDKDGVERGDQGKHRNPHDHNRDYSATPLYQEVASLQRFILDRGNRIVAMVDLHCPAIRGKWNQQVYLVGSDNKRIWEQQINFARILEDRRRGPIPFRAVNCLPFGTDWNTPANYSGGTSSTRWASQNIPEAQLITTIEIPYADAEGIEVNPDSSRLLGRDIATALLEFLERPLTTNN